MLVWGTVNPAGEGNNYRGFYLTRDDIQQCVASGEMVGKPVRIEHQPHDVGRVVAAWQNGRGQMDCVLEVDQGTLQGAVVSKFVNNGWCNELSLGYTVDVANSAGGVVTARNKRVVEVSLVRKGARDNCRVHGFSVAAKKP